MKIIPSVIGNKVPFSEKKVFESIKQINASDSSLCFHSLNVPDHVHKTHGEIDFLILDKRGILVLEVKGGNIKVFDGKWIYQNNKGESYSKSESPFNQAKNNMYSLMNDLKENSITPFISDTLFGYGVIFTQAIFDRKSLEWSDETWIDSTRYTKSLDLKHFIDSLYEYYKKKKKARPLSDRDIENIASYLRPSFELVVDLRSLIYETNYQVNQLTKNQYKILDIIEGNKKILVSGGAGTGKTFLAVENASRNATNGMRTLFTCRSTILGRFIKDRIQNDLTDVVAADELNRLIQNGRKEYYHAIIIDEGQDVLEWRYIEALDSLLKGGLDNGTWSLFYDMNNQSGLFGEFDKEVYEYIKSLSPVQAKLTDNCRNPGPVIHQTYKLTGADLGHANIEGGPSVGWKFYKNRDELIKCVSEVRNEVYDNEVSPENIIYLFDKIDQNASSILKQSLTNGYVYLENQTSYIQKNRIRIAEISQFKGLEEDVVILVITGNIGKYPKKELFYVGMSRCRVKLYLIAPECMQEDILNRFTE